MIDLPGITRNPIPGQPANIEKITKDLVKTYCESQDTLILCVIPANIDLTNSDALKMSSKLDPKGERTIGVLTKIDLMDEGTDAVKTLMNKEIKLLHGYIGVKGRS
jgi:replication fork clamp-binding protein CrfC